MLLSSRANPPKALGDFPSRSNLTVRQLLVNSPLPSPALPALVPRHGKKPPKLNRRRVLRLLLRMCIIISAYYLISRTLSLDVGSSLKSIPYLTPSGKAYEIVGDIDLPEYPTPFSFPDHKGRRRWTIFVPQHLDFPLYSADYADICSHAEEVAHHAGDRGARYQHLYEPDLHYMDVDQAQAAGLLPSQIHIAEAHEDQSLPVCEKSLTFVLDGTDAGLGSTLLALWLSYGLAQEENRAFFLDDSQFVYGRYDTYFKMPSKAACRAPLKTQRVPCPHQAKHLIVSAATYRWTFGSAFSSRHTERNVFDMARNGYEALFKLRSDDDAYAQQRISDLRSPSPSLIVGIHLRRGDRHPFEFAYSQGYLPPHMYKDAAEAFAATSSRSKIVIASDDPDIYLHGDLSSHIRAQELITLASKKTSSTGSLGWEGGFFKDQFWGLGLPAEAHDQRKVGSPLPTRQKPEVIALKGSTLPTEPLRDYRSHPTEEARQLREFIGRAYLLELSVLGRSDRVVCAVSAYACRILAVMMGWERAMELEYWKNIDGKYGWRALDM
ncbi:hypothetical protein DV736_g1156, partial [Chaetothyriales sp. CBS 134916]